MTEENKPDPVAKEKAALYRSLNQLLSLGVLVAVLWGVFWYDFKTCAACEGIGKFIVSCRWCDGDGKVSLWKSFRQARPRSTSSSSTTSPVAVKCPVHSPKYKPTCLDCKKANRP